MANSFQDEQELSEQDLLWAGDGSDDEQHAASSEEPEQPPAVRTEESSSRKLKGLDIAGGASSASHQSSTLRASLEEELEAAGPTPSPPVDVPGAFSRRAADLGHPPLPGKGLHQHHQPYTRLGTSAPIAIPNMAPWRGSGDKGSSSRQPDAASTFIPPHQLSRQDDFTFSFTGASPSAALKRERLRARNAILRSTGFLEPRAGQAVPAAAAAADQPSAGRTPVQSSLTAALTTIGET